MSQLADPVCSLHPRCPHIGLYDVTWQRRPFDHAVEFTVLGDHSPLVLTVNAVSMILRSNDLPLPWDDSSLSCLSDSIVPRPRHIPIAMMWRSFPRIIGVNLQFSPLATMEIHR